MAFTPILSAAQQASSSSQSQFALVKISLASPQQIRRWSFGEITRAETINYRTQKPEKDGLFCERIFGPVRDYECYCGKYKRHRDRPRRQAITCETCGVEVTRSNVRRERMGHIELADPVAHIWFAKGTPSRMSMVLDIPPRELERVLYFSSYIVTEVDEAERELAIEAFIEQRDDRWRALEEDKQLEVMQGGADDFLSELIMTINDYRQRLNPREDEPQPPENATIEEVIDLKMAYLRVLVELELDIRIEEIKDIQVKNTLNETRFQELKNAYGPVFEADMGADAIRKLLEATDLQALKEELTTRIRESSGQKRTKAIKRLSVIEAFITSENRPEWMVLTVLPVLPPDLHPMVQLDGGRYATSDLNDLYRRVINRNNRLKHLKKLSAPHIILRNERRMLQEAVDALIDNGRRGRPVTGRHNHKLKSLTDLLRGKQGRFRQNLLGKRVDFSGRSVIISGPDLKLNECGLPKKMALELFKPFVMHKLIVDGDAHNIKTAKRRIEDADAKVWEAVEEVVQGHPVLLNRAPTLHRLGIQAFYPRLVEGSAIQLHPLVCTAFNADFDGDQMAVHVPLSDGSKREAERLMLSTRNMLAPRSGAPIVTPSLDMLLGIYFLTGPEKGHEVLESMTTLTPDAPADAGASQSNGLHNGNGSGVRFYRDSAEALQAHQAGVLHLRDPIFVRMEGGALVHPSVGEDEFIPGPYAWVKTTVGRVIFNEILPREMGYYNSMLREDDVEAIVRMCFGLREDDVEALVRKFFEVPDQDRTPETFNMLKELGIEYATGSGLSGLREDDIEAIVLKYLEVGGGDVEDVVRKCFEVRRYKRTAEMLDAMKTIGFEYAMRSGTTIAIKDAVPPPEKADQVQQGHDRAAMLHQQFNDGLITEEERYQATIASWTDVTDKITDAVKQRLNEYNGVFAMSDSGAKGNLQQIRQMTGLRGLMSAPGKQWSTAANTLETPIISSLSDGLSVHEYFASTHGSRKALTDTALKTAEAGYLTRRMSDAAQDVIINSQDCNANVGITISRASSAALNVPFEERIAGRYPVRDIIDPGTGGVLASSNDLVDSDMAVRIAATSLDQIEMRSSVGCRLERGVCAKCYGEMLANNRPSILGEAVGIVAAQSIGEPGTQLTMRNFHTGGTATDRDITTGLPRVQELFEARVPKSPAILSEIAGKIERRDEDGHEVIVVNASKTYTETVEIDDGYKRTVKNGDWVDAGSTVAELTARGRKSMTNDAGDLEAQEFIVSPYTGIANFDSDVLTVEWQELDEKAYPVPLNSDVLVSDGDEVEPGAQLTSGQRNPHDILETQGIPAVRNYIIDEAQRVYRSQGVKVHDKHFEVIVKQMLSKVKIVSTGDTNLLIDDVKERYDFEGINDEITAEGGTVAEAKPVLLGISRVALMSKSFLARASFQETERVLTEAALRGDSDDLEGLKENVIIGRMIPANLEKSLEGLEILGLDPSQDPEQMREEMPTFESVLEMIKADVDDHYLMELASGSEDETEIGFVDDDDYEPEPDEVRSAAESMFPSDEPTTIEFSDE